MDNGAVTLIKLGARITQLREQKNMTLLQLSEATDLSIYELTSIEAGKIDMLFEEILAIIHALDTPIADFFTFNTWQMPPIVLGIYPYAIIEKKTWNEAPLLKSI